MAGPFAFRCGRRLLVVRDVELGELLGEPARGPAVPGADALEVGDVLVERGAEARAAAQAEAREGLAVEQADVVETAGQRLGGLDLDPAVRLEPGRGRDQLADDHVL